MADIELNNIGEDRTEQEEAEREEEDTSFTENTDNDNAEYDNTRSQINSEQTKAKTGLGEDDDLTDLEKQIQDHAIKKAIRRYDAIQALESAMDTRFSVTHGENSKDLIDNISDIKYNENGKLIALKFKGEDVKLTAKGKIDKRSAKTHNKDILKAIERAKEKNDKSIASVVNDSANISLSDEAVESIQDSVIDELESFIDHRYNEISQSDSDKNVEREIRGIIHVDDNVDYDNLEDPNKKTQYNAKIADLKANIEHWKDLEQREQDPTKKLLYKSAEELCIVKKSYMEVKAGFRPESEEVLTMIQEEAQRNDLTRFERFKKWAKENIAGVSAVAISIAGIITTIVIAGRSAVKKGAKAVGQFGKALANVAKKSSASHCHHSKYFSSGTYLGSKGIRVSV